MKFYSPQSVPLNQIDEHQIMATDYFNIHATQLRNFWNPASPQALRDSVIKALCYGGLDSTTAWSLLPNQGIDTCKYKAIDASAGRSYTSSYLIQGCGYYNYHYADSLKLRSGCN